LQRVAENIADLVGRRQIGGKKAAVVELENGFIEYPFWSDQRISLADSESRHMTKPFFAKI
jgi:hypothetical protein